MGADVAEQKTMLLSLENAAIFHTLDIPPRHHQGERVDVTWHSPETCTDPPDFSSSCIPKKATLHFQAISKVK